VVSVIQGLNNYVYTKMSFYGANDFAVSKFSPVISSIKDYQEQLKRKDLTLDDLAALRKLCSSCELIGASVNASQPVKYGSKSIKNVEVRGVTSVDHLIGSVLELERGRYLTPDDEVRSRFVCILGLMWPKTCFQVLTRWAAGSKSASKILKSWAWDRKKVRYWVSARIIMSGFPSVLL